jgi:hypothetical protein
MTFSLYLDHIGIAVADLGIGKRDYERLGFTTTPLSLHAAPPEPGAALEPTGSGNHCIMLREGYIELIGVVDPSKPSTPRAFLERYEGPHILAFGSDDVAATRDIIAARGTRIAAPIALERDAAWGPAGTETRRAAFANAHLDPPSFPEARTFVIEHKTRDVVWQAHQLDHANGAVGLTEAWICPADPAEAARRFAQLADSTATDEGDGVWLVRLHRGRLRILSSDAFRNLTGAPPPGVPGMAGIAVAVRDLATTRKLLDGAGIVSRADPRGLLVTGAAIHGSALMFHSATEEQV